MRYRNRSALTFPQVFLLGGLALMAIGGLLLFGRPATGRVTSVVPTTHNRQPAYLVYYEFRTAEGSKIGGTYYAEQSSLTPAPKRGDQFLLYYVPGGAMLHVRLPIPANMAFMGGIILLAGGGMFVIIGLVNANRD